MTDRINKLLEELSNDSKQETSLNSTAGLHGPYGTGKMRILIIDNDGGVIFNFIRELERNLNSDATFYLWCLKRECNADSETLLAWIEEVGQFDGVYIDGDLGEETNGFVLAHRMKKTIGNRYLPIAILTANYSQIEEHALVNPEFQIMLKFGQSVENTIKWLSIALPELVHTNRRSMWSDLQFNVIKKIQENCSMEEVAHSIGEFLVRNDSVTGWYFREKTGDELHAIAMNDIFDGRESLQLDRAPRFFRNLVEKRNPNPWSTKNDLNESSCDPTTEMLGYHCIAALLGEIHDKDLGIFTAYRAPHEREFTKDDARELHHVILQLRTVSERETLRFRQEKLVSTIGKILDAKTSALISDEIRVFLHELLNKKIGGEFTSKTSVRLVERGSGNLIRHGHIGLLSGDMHVANESATLNVNAQSAYGYCIKNAIFLSNNRISKNDSVYLRTSEEASSYLIVPLTYENACIGAVNLENSNFDHFTDADKDIASAFAQIGASVIFARRAEKFMTQLSMLSSLAVNPSSEVDTGPEVILENSILALFDFCGFSNLVIFEPPTNEVPDWKISAGWHSGRNGPERDSMQAMAVWAEKFNLQQAISFILKCSKNTELNRRVFYTNDVNEIARDDGDDNIRPEGQPTLCQIVIRIGDPTNPTLIMSLFFEIPNPLPISHIEILGHFATFMSAVFEAGQEDVRSLAEHLSGSREHLTIGLLYKQLHHASVHMLTRMSDKIDERLGLENEPKLILTDIREQLSTIEEGINQAKVLTEKAKYDDIDISSIWNEVIGALLNAAKRKNVNLVESNLNVTVWGDREFFRLVLYNLIDNAIQYAGEGSEVKLEYESGNLLVFDNGNGILEEYHSVLMELNFTTSTTGSGQGLWLARNVMNVLGGDLSFDRKWKGGARFIIVPPSE